MMSFTRDPLVRSSVLLLAGLAACGGDFVSTGGAGGGVSSVTSLEAAGPDAATGVGGASSTSGPSGSGGASAMASSSGGMSSSSASTAVAASSGASSGTAGTTPCYDCATMYCASAKACLDTPACIGGVLCIWKECTGKSGAEYESCLAVKAQECFKDLSQIGNAIEAGKCLGSKCMDPCQSLI
jgi:hypothetical protein